MHAKTAKILIRKIFKESRGVDPKSLSFSKEVEGGYQQGNRPWIVTVIVNHPEGVTIRSASGDGLLKNVEGEAWDDLVRYIRGH